VQNYKEKNDNSTFYGEKNLGNCQPFQENDCQPFQERCQLFQENVNHFRKTTVNFFRKDVNDFRKITIQQKTRVKEGRLNLYQGLRAIHSTFFRVVQ